jgi:hypothetical protein
MNLQRWVCMAAMAALAGCSAAAPMPVAFEVGAFQFSGGDEILVEEVCSSSGHIAPGAVVTVRGRYRLASRDSGNLYLGTTTHGHSSVLGDDTASSRLVARGSGAFELQHRIPASGYLHVTFYDVQSGAPFGGKYFGRGESLLVAKDWSYAR